MPFQLQTLLRGKYTNSPGQNAQSPQNLVQGGLGQGVYIRCPHQACTSSSQACPFRSMQQLFGMHGHAHCIQGWLRLQSLVPSTRACPSRSLRKPKASGMAALCQHQYACPAVAPAGSGFAAARTAANLFAPLHFLLLPGLALKCLVVPTQACLFQAAGLLCYELSRLEAHSPCAGSSRAACGAQQRWPPPAHFPPATDNNAPIRTSWLQHQEFNSTRPPLAVQTNASIYESTNQVSYSNAQAQHCSGRGSNSLAKPQPHINSTVQQTATLRIAKFARCSTLMMTRQ
eukprot:583271-Pelagomonas_calceolata.AAC.1